MHKTFNKVPLQGLGQVINYLRDLVTHGNRVVKLYGDLGAGKTTFARMLIASLTGQNQRVTSPTFNLVQVYEGAEVKVWHYDLYRVENEEELEELALDDALDDIVIIEWPQIAHNYLPKNSISVNIEFTLNENQRNFTINYEN